MLFDGKEMVRSGSCFSIEGEILRTNVCNGMSLSSSMGSPYSEHIILYKSLRGRFCGNVYRHIIKLVVRGPEGFVWLIFCIHIHGLCNGICDSQKERAAQVLSA